MRPLENASGWAQGYARLSLNLPGARWEGWPELLFTNREEQSFCFIADDWCVLRFHLFPIYKIILKEPWFASSERRPAGK